MVSKKRKKVFTEIETDFSAITGNSNTFSFRITTSTSQIRHPISFGGGGAVFNFSPKIGLKSTKNVRFCIFYKPMEGLEPPPPPPPPGYATAFKEFIELWLFLLLNHSHHSHHNLSFSNLDFTNVPTRFS